MILVTDRTQQDIDQETDKAFIDYEDLNRIKDAIAELKQKADDAGYGFVQTFLKEWSIEDIRTKAEIDKLKNDLLSIRGLVSVPTNTPQVPQKPFENFSKANDTEQIISIVNSLIDGIVTSFKYSGEFYAGEEL